MSARLAPPPARGVAFPQYVVARASTPRTCGFASGRRGSCWPIGDPSIFNRSRTHRAWRARQHACWPIGDPIDLRSVGRRDAPAIGALGRAATWRQQLVACASARQTSCIRSGPSVAMGSISSPFASGPTVSSASAHGHGMPSLASSCTCVGICRTLRGGHDQDLGESLDRLIACEDQHRAPAGIRMLALPDLAASHDGLWLALRVAQGATRQPHDLAAPNPSGARGAATRRRLSAVVAMGATPSHPWRTPLSRPPAALANHNREGASSPCAPCIHRRDKGVMSK